MGNRSNAVLFLFTKHRREQFLRCFVLFTSQIKHFFLLLFKIKYKINLLVLNNLKNICATQKIRCFALVVLGCCLFCTSVPKVFAQEIDSTQVGKEYPFLFPVLGKKAYKKGYKLQLPHGFMLGGIYNKQGIVLDEFEMAFTQNDESPDFSRLEPISDLIEFGKSDGRIATVNARFDTWILPFLSVGGYYGKVWGDQTIRLTAPVTIESTTDIDGKYYGINLLAVAPLGPVNIGVDYSWSWTTNVRLDEPVRVEVSGLRIIKRFMTKTPDRFWAVWGGAQFQKLDSKTSGKIDLAEALNLNPDALEDIDQQWEDYKMSPDWEELSFQEKAQAELRWATVRGFLGGLSESTVHYKFNKRLEYNWNMILGFNYQHSQKWQLRAEYGALKSKQQLMLAINYRFGL